MAAPPARHGRVSRYPPKRTLDGILPPLLHGPSRTALADCRFAWRPQRALRTQTREVAVAFRAKRWPTGGRYPRPAPRLGRRSRAPAATTAVTRTRKRGSLTSGTGSAAPTSSRARHVGLRSSARQSESLEAFPPRRWVRPFTTRHHQYGRVTSAPLKLMLRAGVPRFVDYGTSMRSPERRYWFARSGGGAAGVRTGAVRSGMLPMRVNRSNT